MRFLRSPPVTMTQPTWRRSQLERDDIRTAVAMKYSSHDGRCGKLLAASAIRSTGNSGTAGTAGLSGAGFAERLMMRQDAKGLRARRQSRVVRNLLNLAVF